MDLKKKKNEEEEKKKEKESGESFSSETRTVHLGCFQDRAVFHYRPSAFIMK